jgi:hypothetical protein
MDTIQQILGEFDSNFPATTSTVDEEVLSGMFTTLGLLIGTLFLIILLAVYIYNSLTLYKIAQKLNVDKPWLAWIPIVKIYLILVLGDMSPYFILLYISPFILGLFSVVPDIGILFNFLLLFAAIAIMAVNVISYMNISEKRGYDKLLGLLAIYPLTSYILMGILAWGEKSAEN